MSGKRVLVVSEGESELGGHPPGSGDEWALDPDRLPALPRLVHRLTGEPAGVEYYGAFYRTRKHARGGLGSREYRKLKWTLQHARDSRYDALAYVIDRDGPDNRKKIGILTTARDDYVRDWPFPCAVGTAVETFDAWMIADPNAVAAAGGDKEKCHPDPEKLDGKEGSGRHAKDCAANAFGGADGLSDRYAEVAGQIDLDHLERSCPQGFAPFAREVRERIAPAIRPVP